MKLKTWRHHWRSVTAVASQLWKQSISYPHEGAQSPSCWNSQLPGGPASAIPESLRWALAVSMLVKQDVQSHIRHFQAQIPLVVEGTECSKTLGTSKHFTLIFMSKISFKGKLLVRNAMVKALVCSSCWTDYCKQWVNEFSLWFPCPVCRGDFFITSRFSVVGGSCKVGWRTTICAKCAGRS